MNSKFDLERFLKAQERSYPQALNEIRAGHKQGHWIWYIFPQIIGLGMSSTAIYYSIASLEEAKAYMQNDILKERLIEISQALLDCNVEDPIQIFGGLDAKKVRSSMTLFELTEASDIFEKVLEKLYNGERDLRTLSIIANEIKN